MSPEFSDSERDDEPINYESYSTNELRNIVENISKPDVLSRIIKIAAERHFDNPNDTESDELVRCAIEKQGLLLKDDLAIAMLDVMTRLPSTDQDYKDAAARIALFRSPQE